MQEIDFDAWCQDACDGSLDCPDELVTALADFEDRQDWLRGIADWALDNGLSLSLHRLRAGLKLGGMAPGDAVAYVAGIREHALELRRMYRAEDERFRITPIAESQRAHLTVELLRARADADRMTERGRVLYVPTAMARGVFDALAVDAVELARWREVGILKCDAGGFTTRVRLGYERPRVYAFRLAMVGHGAGLQLSGPGSMSREALQIASMRAELARYDEAHP